MCVICDTYNDGTILSMIKLNSFTVINCEGCNNIITIPIINNLTELNCSGCTSLTKISISKNMKNLICDECPSLKEIILVSDVTNLDYKSLFNSISDVSVHLDYNNFPSVQTIVLTNEESLNIMSINCNNCLSLDTILIVDNIISPTDNNIELNYNNCPLLKKVSVNIMKTPSSRYIKEKI
jgi:hypothetical protein